MPNQFKMLPNMADGHAIKRCLERARITPEEFLAEADSHAILIMHVSDNSRHWLVWIKKTSKAHVFISNSSGVISTIFPALSKGSKWGGLMDNPGKEDKTTRIKSYWLVQALKAAGEEPIAAVGLINYLRKQEHESSPHADKRYGLNWYYCWILRFSYEDSNGKFVRRNEKIHHLLIKDVIPNENVLNKVTNFLRNFKNVHDVDLIVANKNRDETYQSFGLNYLGGVVALEGGNNGI